MFQILRLGCVGLVMLLVFQQSSANQAPFLDTALLDGAKPDNSDIQSTKKAAKDDEATLPALEFKTIEWIDLMPKEDLEAILNPPDYLAEIEDGSDEDQIDSKIGNNIAQPNDRYQQALVSTDVVSDMDGQSIRIPGFIVPLEFNDELDVTQFFLVPFFGACIHLPPPPPNQIIFIDYPEGLELKSPYQAFWMSGVVKTSLLENEVAKSAYSLNIQYIEDYVE